jgi:PAS domain S-box-containing protein
MAVEKFPDEISSIRALLSENPEGLTIKSISEMLGLNRNSAANTLHLLQMQGRVTLKRVGAAKIYCHANKLPVDAVLKLSNNGVIVLGRGETVIDMNEQFRELLQMEKRDLIGKTTGQLTFFVESHPELPRLVRDALRGKEYRISAELVLADRSLPCTLTILPVFFENGDSGVALIVDIPAGGRYPHRNGNVADDSLAELDMTEYICRFEPDGTLTYVNQAYGNLLQKGKTELIGHTWRPTVPESEYNKIKQRLLSLDSDHPVTSLDFKVITPRGDSRWQRWRFRNLFDQAGMSIGYQGTGSDITDMKNLEETVRKGAEERERLVRERLAEFQDLNRQIYNEIASHEKTHIQLQFTQFAIDNASYLIMWASREGRFVYMNREAQAVLGYQHRDLITKKFQDIITEGFPFPWDEIWEAILRDRQYVLETALLGHDGREVPVEMVLNYLGFKDKQYCCCFAKDITEKKQAENALRESEQKYRDIFEKSISGLFKSAPDGRLIDANDAFAHMYGYSDAAEMLAAGLDIGWHLYADPEDRNEVLRILAEQDKIENYETLHKKRDGTRFWVSIIARTIRDTDGTVVLYDGMYVDITGRKVADQVILKKTAELHAAYEELAASQEELHANLDELTRQELALRESEEKYRQLVDLAQEGIWAIDADGKTSYVNPRMAEMLGYTVEEMQGAHLFYFMDDAGKTIAAENIERRRQGIKEGHEFEFITKGGDRIYAALSTASITDEKGVYKGALAVVSDITGRKQAEEALRNREHDFSTLVENATDMIVRFDTGLRYLYCNPAVERQMGIPSHLLAGKTPLESRISVEESRFIETSLRKTLETGAEQEVEQSVPTPSGLRHFLTRIVPERDPDGSIISLLAITRDITERKVADEVLREKSQSALKTTSDSLQKTEAELQLHQTELEMQNEELRSVQANLERSRERYFELYDLAPAGYLTLSKKGLVLNANFTAATLLGVDRKNLIGMPFGRFIVQDDQAVFYGCRNELIETGERQSCELHMMYPDDSTFRVQVIVVPAPASEGDEAAISLMLIDIAGRKQTDEVLQKREKIFGVMFESHDSVMLLIDPGSGMIIDANLAAERFYGRSRETLYTLSIDEINTLPPKEVKALLAKVARGQITSFTARHRRSSGEIRDVEVHSSPVTLEGKPVLFSIIHDITDRKWPEEKLDESPGRGHGLR